MSKLEERSTKDLQRMVDRKLGDWETAAKILETRDDVVETTKVAIKTAAVKEPKVKAVKEPKAPKEPKEKKEFVPRGKFLKFPENPNELIAEGAVGKIAMHKEERILVKSIGFYENRPTAIYGIGQLVDEAGAPIPDTKPVNFTYKNLVF